MPDLKSVVHFLLVDFGGEYLLVTCDRGKTKSTPSLTDLDCTVRLDWSLTKDTFSPKKSVQVALLNYISMTSGNIAQDFLSHKWACRTRY